MRRNLCFSLALTVGGVLTAGVHAQPASGPMLLPPPVLNAPAEVISPSPPQPPAAFGNSEQPTFAPPQLAPVEIEPASIVAEQPHPMPKAIAPELAQEEIAGPMIHSDRRESPTRNRPTYWFGPPPWDTGIELGINGSAGTSESVSIRTGGYIKRESRFSKLDLHTNYNYTTNSGIAQQNNAEFDVRNDWLLDDHSPWTLYGTGNLFYDEFQAFDLQASANTGVGYRLVHQPGLDLIGRFGGGVSREIGGPEDRWVPESLVGLEYSQQLWTTQRFYGRLDYYPEWEQFGEYRLVADTGWEIALVQPSNLSLKISATDRFDSTPNGANPHLLNYSVLLLLKL